MILFLKNILLNILNPTCKIGLKAEISWGVKLGRNVIIESGVCIFEDVVIRNNVELCKGTIVGARTFIDSGVTVKGNAYISMDCTIRNNVVIARGSRIGANCFIAPQVVFNNLDLADHMSVGGAKLGNNVIIGTGTKLHHGIHITDNVMVGALCFIRESINKSGVYIQPQNPLKKLR